MEIERVKYYMDQDHKSHLTAAREHLRLVLKDTSLIYSDFFSSEYNCQVYLKPENLQTTGSFKLRGAFNKVATLSEEEKSHGVICSSAGNHAQGVAFSAQRKGIKSVIVMPSITPLVKVEATKAYGSEVILYGDVYDDAYTQAVKLSKEHGYTFVHPFDDYEVICGQGTIGLEILDALDDVDEIIVPVGGGGLVAGIALAVKTFRPSVKVIGAEPAGAMSMKVSLDDGQIARLADVKTIAEGVAVRQVGDLPFAIAQKYVDEVVAVSEKDIMESVLMLLDKHKLIAEAAGVVTLAALKKRAKEGKKIACVISGGNIDVVTISSIINQGLITRGRIMCFSVDLPDKPGQLLKVASLLAELGANVISLDHNQFKTTDRYSNKVRLEITAETNGQSHIKQITEILEDNGFLIHRVY